MKKVFIVLIILLGYSCSAPDSKNSEELYKEQQALDRQHLTDSLSGVYAEGYLAKEQLLMAEIDSLSKLLVIKSPKLAQYQSQIKVQRDSLNSLQQQLKTLSKATLERDSLATVIADLKKERTTLIRARDQFADQVKSLETEVARLKGENEKLKETPVAPAKDLDKYKVDGNAVSYLQSEEGRSFVVYTVDPVRSEVRFFWRDQGNELYDNFMRYRADLESRGELLLFATNGGMYQPDQSPQGLYIEDSRTLQKADTRREGYGNFYMQPNGIFLITEKGEPHVITTQDLRSYERRGIRYATQSGPMLLVDGKMNSKFMKDSPNFHIRSGVGVNDQGKIVFIISETRVRFYELAKAFEKMGCKNALYLDGAISQTYLPEVERSEAGGGFGVMIGVSKKN